jgi:hypothetical protein
MSNAIQTYYDPETGKTIVYGNAEEVSIMSRDDLEAWREVKARKEAMKLDQRHYVNCYHSPIVELNEILAVNELGTIAKLLPYIKMSSGGKLFYEGKRMGIVEVRKAIGKGQRQATTLVTALVDSGVMFTEYEGKRLVYGVSERFHTIGHTLVNQYYTKVYQTKLRAELKDVSIQAAGVLYKALPFFHYSRYYLCHNPNTSEDLEEIRHLTQRKFAEIVNVDRKVVDRAIKELAQHGFVMISKAYGATVIMVNPDVMFRQKIADEYTDFVRNQFSQAKASVEQNGADVDIAELPF